MATGEPREKVKRVFALLIGLVFLGTLAISFDQGLSLGESLSRTVSILRMEPLTPGGLSDATEALLLLASLGVLWLVVWTSMDMFTEGHASSFLEKTMKEIKMKRTKDHVIICGAGRVGSNIAKELAEAGEKFVLIEKDERCAEKMKRRGCIAVQGDCLDEATLKEAGIEKAKRLAAVIGATEKNLYLTLLAKELNPDIEVFARANDEKIAKKLKTVGADHVVMPEVAGAKTIAKKILK